jgi:hypothetical protein
MSFTITPTFGGNGQMQPIGRPGSVMNGLTGGDAREGSVVGGLRTLGQSDPNGFFGLGGMFSRGGPGQGAPDIAWSPQPKLEEGPGAGAGPATPAAPAAGAAPAAPGQGAQPGGLVGFLTGLFGGGGAGLHSANPLPGQGAPGAGAAPAAPGGGGAPAAPGGGGLLSGLGLGGAPAAAAPAPATPSPQIAPPPVLGHGWNPNGFGQPNGQGQGIFGQNGYLGTNLGIGAPPP